MKKNTSLSTFVVGLVALTTLIAETNLPVPGPTLINARRPLSDASSLLHKLYGKVVTYEEPLLIWRGELEGTNGRSTELKWGLHPQKKTFTMPADTGVNSDLGYVLNEVLQNFHQQTTGTRFKVISSALGYHIVPVQVRNESGLLVDATSVLDNRITVPTGERQGFAHLQAFAAAVRDASKTRVEEDIGGGSLGSFDGLFRQGRRAFTWGVADMTARDALIDLLQQSQTTFLWYLHCQSSVRVEDRFCVINIGGLGVVLTDTKGNRHLEVQRYDRCANCTNLDQPRQTN